MPYVDPETVVSPRDRVSDVHIVFDRGRSERSWSIARLRWDGDDAVGIRWNGDADNPIGTPQSRGIPTWFIVPAELQDAVLRAAEQLARRTTMQLSAGYQRMAEDQEREREAQQWSEGLIGDASAQR